MNYLLDPHQYLPKSYDSQVGQEGEGGWTSIEDLKDLLKSHGYLRLHGLLILYQDAKTSKTFLFVVVA